MISLFLTTSFVLLRIRQTINSVDEVDFTLEDLRFGHHGFDAQFNRDYLVDFILPVTSLCLTLLSIMVELQQVINMCLDMDEEEAQAQS